MILGLLLLGPPRLTFEAHAEEVKSVVERLSKATGSSLLCANDVGLRRVTALVKETAATLSPPQREALER